jgi:pimeloyl-ACP methyl ester carboxylesterase
VRRAAVAALLVIFGIVAAPAAGAGSSAKAGPLPPPVEVRQEPEGVTLGDPALEPAPGARADYGRLGGSVYQIEIPQNWNGKLVLFLHGYEELGTEANTGPPDTRRYFLGKGYAWGASSFSSTSWIPGRAADETAALWDYFARTYGQPTRTYVTGFSMGGLGIHIVAERYPDRFDGALALCGSAGGTPAMASNADFFAAAAYAAGVTQAEFDGADVETLISDRIFPALQHRKVHERFEKIMLDLTGGQRAFDREGFRAEETTNWRRTSLAVQARIAPNRDTVYRLSRRAGVSSDEFNRAVVRLPVDDAGLQTFVDGSETTGNLRMPLLSLHSTGDGQVPIEQARIHQRIVDAAGKSDLLVQRLLSDPSHCGFTNTEIEATFDDLVAWVEQDRKPKGHDVLTDDWRRLRPRFELNPRPGTREANTVKGARDRVVLRGKVTRDGRPFDADPLGVEVRHHGLTTPCQYALTPVTDGRYRITVQSDTEASGCGAPGGDLVLWTFVDGERLYSREKVRWPGDGSTKTLDATFSTSEPDGVGVPGTGFAGEVYQRDGTQLGPGTRVEAYVGETRCALASVRRTGNFSGFSLIIAGPDAVPGCAPDATLTFRIDGRPAVETKTNDGDDRGPLDLSLP